MAKRTNQEIDDHIMELFGFRRWSPKFAQRILSKNYGYNSPGEADMLGSVGRLLTLTRIRLVQAGYTDMQSVYVTTESRPTME